MLTGHVQWKCYYAVLGLRRGATFREIKTAYYKKSKEHHPDTSVDAGDSKTDFMAVREAYEVLKDEEQRKQYDAYTLRHKNNTFFKPTKDGFNAWKRAEENIVTKRTMYEKQEAIKPNVKDIIFLVFLGVAVWSVYDSEKQRRKHRPPRKDHSYLSKPQTHQSKPRSNKKPAVSTLGERMQSEGLDDPISDLRTWK